MPIFQAYNGRIKAWVKYDFSKGKVRFLNVKQREPEKPFKGVKKRGKRYLYYVDGKGNVCKAKMSRKGRKKKK